MRRSTLVTLVIALVLVLLGASLVLSKNAGQQTKSSPSPSTALTETTASPSASTAAGSTASPAASPATVVMSYTSSGFSPTSITVKKGAAITFKNESSASVQVDSNPHPIHTDNPELNVGVISPGGSKTVTLNRTGTWKIHNHLSPSNEATIMVE